MDPKLIVFAIITFLHDLFTAVWIGGLITLGLTVLPSAKKVLGKGPEMKKLMDAIQKRLSVLVYVSIVGLLLTGLLQANRAADFQGLFSFANTYSIFLSLKHVLVLAMIAITLYRSLVLGRRTGPSTPAQEKLSVKLLLLNMVLGVAVLLHSGFGAALAAVPPA
ncbi:MAG: CopD family protein [Anaerolineales bacterium]|jgi:putative copper export protein|nr:CopD family protein [Anaerolineales bacterium]